jgi:hypothetical protein
MIEDLEVSTQPAGQLAEPPRWPPTAIGIDELPQPGDDGRPDRYRMPLLRRVSLMMLAVLLAVGSIGVAAAPIHAGPLGIAARTVVSGTLGAAGMSTYRRALPPPTAFELLRAAREARWRQQERFHRARMFEWPTPNDHRCMPSILKRVALRAKTWRRRGST